MSMRDELKYNGSGIKDPTAYKAIKRADGDRNRRANQLINAIHLIAHLAGFEVIGRIELKDNTTGEIWR